MKGIGTDEEALIEIICTKSNEQLEAIKECYSDVIGRDLESDIESETRGDFKRLLIAVLQAQREEPDDVDEDAAQVEFFLLNLCLNHFFRLMLKNFTQLEKTVGELTKPHSLSFWLAVL